MLARIAVLATLIWCTQVMSQLSIEWSQTFDVAELDAGWDAIQDSHGDLVVVFSGEDWTDVPEDSVGYWAVAKIDLDGTVYWFRRYLMSGLSLRVVEREDGNFEIAGTSTAILTLSPEGDSLYSVTYPLPPGHSIPITGSFVPASGHDWYMSITADNGLMVLAKWSANGEQRWAVTYDRVNVDWTGLGGSLMVDTQGGAYCCLMYRRQGWIGGLEHRSSEGDSLGFVTMTNMGATTYLSDDTFLNRYGSTIRRSRLSGTAVWRREFGFPTIVLDARSSGESVVVVDRGTPTNPDLWIDRTSGNGDSLWAYDWPDSLFEPVPWGWGQSIKWLPDGSLLLLDDVMSDDPGSDARVTKLSPVQATPGAADLLTPTCWLAPAAPNPFNSATDLHYYLPRQGWVMLSVYDVLGREVQTLVNANQSAGTHDVRLDGSSLASGIYFCQLTVEIQRLTEKIVLLK